MIGFKIELIKSKTTSTTSTTSSMIISNASEIGPRISITRFIIFSINTLTMSVIL